MGFLDRLRGKTEKEQVLSRAKKFGEKGQWNKAVEEYEKAIELDPNDAHSHADLGFAYGMKGHWDEAMQECGRAIKLNPNLAIAHLNLGFAFTQKGDLEKAKREFRKAKRLDSSLKALTCVYLGDGYKSKGLIDKAIKEYKKAITIDQDLAVAHLNLGKAYYMKGDLSKEIEEYERVIELEPKDKRIRAIAHTNLGLAYIRINRGLTGLILSKFPETDISKIPSDWKTKAIEQHKKAIELDPNFSLAHNNLGFAYEEDDRLELAIVEYKTAIQLDPNAATAHYNLGNAYIKKGARDLISRARKRGKAIREVKAKEFAFEKDYDKKGWFEKAITEHEEAVELEPHDPQNQFALATAYLWGRHYDQAKEQARIAQKLGKSKEDVEKFVAQIRAIRKLYTSKKRKRRS